MNIDGFFKQEGVRYFADKKKFWLWSQNKVGKQVVNQLINYLNQRATGEFLGNTTFYDFIADPQTSVISSSSEYNLIKAIADWVEPKLPNTGFVLELGCHTGLLTRYYALSRPETQVIGIDISQQAIETAKKIAMQKKIPNIIFCQADILDNPQFPNQKIDCIVSGRIFSELMTRKIRYQQSWNQISYPPAEENLDKDVAVALKFCQNILSKDGKMLLTERLSNYDRLNRLWQRLHNAGLQSQLGNIESINWVDIAGKHKTWFFTAKKSTVILDSPPPINPFIIPNISKHVELTQDESRILIKGLMAFQLWSSLKYRERLREHTIKYPNGGEEYIEVGFAQNHLGYAFIGTNFGDYLITFFAHSETTNVLADIDEYFRILKEQKTFTENRS